MPKTNVAYRFRDGVPILLDRAGLTQSELARIAGVDRFLLNVKIKKRQPTQGVFAWKIARVYARAAAMGEEEAFATLWERMSDGEAQNITKAPSLARAATLI